MARRAVILHHDSPGPQEQRLGKILTFFGVPWQALGIREVGTGSLGAVSGSEYSVFGATSTLMQAMSASGGANAIDGATSLYVYSDFHRGTANEALVTLLGPARWRTRPAPGHPVTVAISKSLPEFTGPMCGIDARVQLSELDSVLLPIGTPDSCDSAVISAGEHVLLLKTKLNGVELYINGSSTIVDIDEPVGSNYYDVKVHLASAVPLVMFITATFREVMWRSEELGACLIIDDPLLKNTYGFCDFARLRDLMRQHDFTTNIAFIPWNWRRTTQRGSRFFRQEADRFSVSIHGCDHVADEFGTNSVDALERKATLAQTRMRKHQNRTGVAHERVMVFPQGVFSRKCPSVLKRAGFLAAVNTEIAPVNDLGASTTVRDVWSVAILAYGSFPIFTRRYAFHGMENFAFDLLLGKPCFIVAHHDFFHDGGAALVALVNKLASLNCTLHWRSPGEVVRRSCRRRSDDSGEHVEMFGTELLLSNNSDGVQTVCICKSEDNLSIVAGVDSDGERVQWMHTPGGLSFERQLPPGSRALIRVLYDSFVAPSGARNSLKYELAVAARRIFSELRDEYVHKLSHRAAVTHPAN